MQQSVRTLNVAECGFASRSYFTQLYTPMMLTRYGGDVWDEDPRYNHSDVPLLPADARLAFMTDPCVSLTDNLDFGVISAGYGGLWHNTSTANIFSAITPITATEVGEGFLLGEERAVTKVSGVYRAPPSTPRNTSHVVLMFRHCYLEGKVIVREPTVKVAVGQGMIAVIVWGAKTAELHPVGPQALKVDDDSTPAIPSTPIMGWLSWARFRCYSASNAHASSRHNKLTRTRLGRQSL